MKYRTEEHSHSKRRDERVGKRYRRCCSHHQSINTCASQFGDRTSVITQPCSLLTPPSDEMDASEEEEGKGSHSQREKQINVFRLSNPWIQTYIRSTWSLLVGSNPSIDSRNLEAVELAIQDVGLSVVRKSVGVAFSSAKTFAANELQKVSSSAGKGTIYRIKIRSSLMASNLAFGIALEISREVLTISLTSHLNQQRMPISRSASPVCDVSPPQDAGHVRKLEVEIDCEENNVSVSSSGSIKDVRCLRWPQGRRQQCWLMWLSTLSYLQTVRRITISMILHHLTFERCNITCGQAVTPWYQRTNEADTTTNGLRLPQCHTQYGNLSYPIDCRI